MTPKLTPTESQLSVTDAAKFILAGKATFTLRSQKTGTRYTYRVSQAKERSNFLTMPTEIREQHLQFREKTLGEPVDTWFVSLLSGPDNEGDYMYLGMIRNGQFLLTKKSRMTSDSLPVKAFRWTWEKLVAGVEPQQVEIWHAGKCGRCGRTLTVPESISSGYGPECIQHV